MYLVLTGLELNLIKNEKLVCLGLWTKKYDQKNKLRDAKNYFIEDPWNNRKRFFKDHKYLFNLHCKALKEISITLNRIHKEEHSVRYWQTLLDPWLLIYISAIYDRWIRLEDAFLYKKRYSILIPKESFKHEKCFFSNEINDLVQSDKWNHNLFVEILNYKYQKNIDILEFIFSQDRKKTKNKKKFLFKQYILDKLEFVLNLLTKIDSFLGIQPKIFFYLHQIKPLSLIRLNLALRQNPFFRYKFCIKKSNLNLDNSEKIFKKEKLELGDSEFERFLCKRLYKDLPSEFTSGYKNIRALTKGFYTPKIIVSDCSHWFNTLFKYWLAQCYEKGAKIITSQHGGSICEGMPNDMNFQEAISDKYISWSKPLSEKQIQLTPLKFAGRNYNFKNYKSKYISYLALDRPRYLIRSARAADSGQIFLHHQQTLEFFKGLNKISKNKFRIRPYPSFNSWGLANDYIKYFGKSKVSQSRNYYSFLESSSIIICSYPETTFSECISRNIPTILLYPASLWESHKFILPTLKKLKKANIIFHDPVLAARHVNCVNHNPLEWWNSSEVINALEEFREVALPNSRNWLLSYKNFLKAFI